MTNIEIDNIFPQGYKGVASISDVRLVITALNDGGHFGGGGGVPTDAYTKVETDTLLDTKLNLSGGTLTGHITLATPRSSRFSIVDGNNSFIMNSDKATFVSNSNTLGLGANTNGTSLDFKINGSVEMAISQGLAPSTKYAPTLDEHLTRKDYVDGLIGGGGTSSGFEKITTGKTSGWRLIGQDAQDFNFIGQNAVDASSSQTIKGTSSLGASGNFAFCSGADTKAQGDYSQAGGYQTTASGNYSQAGGYQTTASSEYSYAEGYDTLASGEGSHAEGKSTVASGGSSHAEGYDTTSSGDYGSHAEGKSTVASGGSSHAEGTYTTASGENSHAEGNATSALYDSGHAEGNNTRAEGYQSHAEGNFTVATGGSSHAEGDHTIALNPASHAQGTYNTGTATDTIHETGIGSAALRKNAFEIYTDGRLVAPELTQALINTPKSLVTKEYSDSQNNVAVDPGDSVATDVPTLVQDYNMLLANLRTAGIIV